MSNVSFWLCPISSRHAVRTEHAGFMIERPTFREISDCLETKWDFMNVRYITWRGEWRSRHLCLSGYKLEPARRSEVHRDSRERRRGEPQTANPVANGPARGWARGGVVVVVELGRRGWGVGWRGGEEGERESELFIAVNGYAVHKDCSEGYPKERGQRRQVSLIWIKGWRWRWRWSREKW